MLEESNVIFYSVKDFLGVVLYFLLIFLRGWGSKGNWSTHPLNRSYIIFFLYIDAYLTFQLNIIYHDSRAFLISSKEMTSQISYLLENPP